MNDTALVHFSRAREALQKATTLDEVKAVMNTAELLRRYARRVDGSLEMQNEAADIKLRAERLAGVILKEGAESGDRRTADKGRPKKPDTMSGFSETPSLKEIGISEKQSSRWQSIASIPEEEFEAVIQERKQARLELTEAGMLRIARGKAYDDDDVNPHVSYNSGDDEWYTPAEYIEAARAVMGGFDFDPASSAIANEIVQAAVYFTAEDDGLTKQWRGRVWMNPPYAGELIGEFTSKLCDHFSAGEVTEAIVLVNNATETGWFQEMAALASAICFPRGRVKFWHPEKESAPLQGQALLYFGAQRQAFRVAFGSFGFCVELT